MAQFLLFALLLLSLAGCLPFQQGAAPHIAGTASSNNSAAAPAPPPAPSPAVSTETSDNAYTLGSPPDCKYNGNPIPSYGWVELFFMGSAWSNELVQQRARIITDVTNATKHGYFSKAAQYGVQGVTINYAYALDDSYLPPNDAVIAQNWSVIDPYLKRAVTSQLPAPSGELGTVYVFIYPPSISQPGGFHTVRPLFSDHTTVAILGYYADSPEDTISRNTMHELLEALTDPPYGKWGWTCGFEELGDVCGPPVFVPELNFSPAAYWSIADHTCVAPYISDPSPPSAGGAGSAPSPSALHGGAEIVAVYAGKCLDDIGFNTADGAFVGLWDCNGKDNQNWILSPTGNSDGSYYIVNAYAGKCLDDIGWHTDDGSPVALWGCNGQANQQWRIVPAPSGGNFLVSVYSGKVIDDLGWNTDNGAPIALWTQNGKTNQQWFGP